MLVKSTPAEQRIVLQNIGWETFEALLRDTGEDRVSWFAYDCGVLEIITSIISLRRVRIDRFVNIGS
jgi:hypothetical protein